MRRPLEAARMLGELVVAILFGVLVGTLVGVLVASTAIAVFDMAPAVFRWMP